MLSIDMQFMLDEEKL